MEHSMGRYARLPPLIGRDAALTETKALLPTTPLLSLIGAGGCGKTRLALEIARDVQAEYPDGAWIVELAPLDDPELLADVVCQALAVQRAPHLSAVEGLVAALRDREALLVFDNCEHLLPTCVEAIESLLRACPRLRILATSRETLRSVFELAWPVPPLSVPLDRPLHDAASAGASAAVQLFVQRAAAVLPAFTLTDENATAISRICQRLDGLPLAIEIAACCVNALAPEQLAAEIAGGLLELAEGYRTRSPRQRTLDATIEWSMRLLTPDERVLFRRVSILAGTFDLRAAAAVDGRSARIVLNLLRKLVEKSLILVDQRDGAARYRMLETLRDYGQRQPIAAGEQHETYQRYCAWVSQVVTEASRRDGDEQARWLDLCERELNHIRAMLTWLLDQGQASDTEAAARLATSLAAFWRQRGHIGEGKRWLERVLAADSDAAVLGPQVRARALNALGVLAMWQCAYAQARACHEGALTLFEQSRNQHGVARTHFRLGFLAARCEDVAVATKHLEKSLVLSDALGDAWGADAARNRLGIVAWNRGDHACAAEHLEHSLQFQRAQGDTGACASTLLNLGMLALECSDPCHATSLLRESLSFNHALGDQLALTYVHTYLGYAALEEHEMDASATSFGNALALVEPDAGAEIVSRLLDGIGAHAAQQHSPSSSARIWGAMDAFRTRHGVSYRPRECRRHNEEVAEARDGEGAQAFATEWERGQAMSLAEALLDAHRYLAQCADRPVDDHFTATCAKTSDAQAARTSPVHLSAALEPEPTALRIQALGQIKIYRGELCVTAKRLTYAKARELLFFLLTHSPSTRDKIGLALWPDATPDYLQMTFRVVVYHLRRALGPGAWILRDQHYYAFNRSLGHWYDVEAFEIAASRAAQQRLSAPDEAIATLEIARSLYRGDFWEGATASEWIAQEQERLQRRYLECLLLLGDLYLERGVGQRALETYTHAIDRDPYCEEAHRGVMRCYLMLHETAKATQHFEHLRRELQEHLGLSPAVETRALLRP